MQDTRDFVQRIISTSRRNLWLFALSFEDRCKALPRLLHVAKADRARNRMMCIVLSDDNVIPHLISKRKENRQDIESLVAPDFTSSRDLFVPLNDALSHATGSAQTNIIVDASAMPRWLIFHILNCIAGYRSAFERVYVVYSHPLRYLPGGLEIPSPFSQFLHDSPEPRDASDVSLVLFPGFNSTETSLVLSRILEPRGSTGSVRMCWAFTHPGSHYEFYERALGEHMVFLELLKKDMTPRVELCRMNDFRQIAAIVTSHGMDLGSEEALFVASLGPRVISVPVFLATAALRSQHKKVNALVPLSLSYNSLRSEGEGRSVTWDLQGEYRVIRSDMTPQSG